MWQRQYGRSMAPCHRVVLRPMVDQLVNQLGERLVPRYLIWMQIIFVSSSVNTLACQLLQFPYTVTAPPTQALRTMRSSPTSRLWRGNNRQADESNWKKYSLCAMSSFYASHNILRDSMLTFFTNSDHDNSATSSSRFDRNNIFLLVDKSHIPYILILQWKLWGLAAAVCWWHIHLQGEQVWIRS